MNMTNEEYSVLVSRSMKPTPTEKNMLWAFLTGGTICMIGELLNSLYSYMGLNQEQSALAVSVTLIAAAALLTGLGVFDKLAKHAGAGTLVPITGFANAVVSPALEFKTEGLLTGTAVNMFKVAGPVLVYGIGASVVYGAALWVVTG